MFNHEQVIISFEKNGYEFEKSVDKKIAFILKNLFKLNFDIINSCEGYPEGFIYIEFFSSHQAERFLNILSCAGFHEINNWKYKTTPIIYGEYYKFSISVTFPENELNEVNMVLEEYINRFQKEDIEVIEIKEKKSHSDLLFENQP